MNTIKREIFLLFSAVMFTLSSASVLAGERIKIVSAVPLSGSQQITGESITLGAQLAMEDFGIDIASQGFELLLQREDDKATPEVGVENAKRFTADSEVLAVVGHFNSGVTIPASEIYAKAGLAMVTPGATNPIITDRPSTGQVVSRICGRDDIQGPAGADFAASVLKVKKVFVINDKTAYGTGVSKGFEETMRKMGVNVAYAGGVDETVTDFSTVVNRVATEKPDLVYFGGIHGQGGLLIKQLRQKGFKTVVMGGDGLDSSNLQEIAGAENMANVYYTTTAAPLNMLPAAKNFEKDYKKRFGKEPEPYSVYGYDAMHVVLEGLAKAIKASGGKKPTREQVVYAIRSVKIKGLTATNIQFNRRGDIKIAKYVVIKAGPTYDKNDVNRVFGVQAPHI